MVTDNNNRFMAASGLAQSTSVAGESAASGVKRGGPLRLILLGAVLLSIAVVSGTAFYLISLRNHILAYHGQSLSNTALILAKHKEQVFASLEAVQEIVSNQPATFGLVQAASHDDRLSSYAAHRKLRDLASALPLVGSLTIVNAQGRLVNFSRQWPIPDIDVADRSFFKALQSDPNLTSFLSEPIFNRATGSRVIHYARRISGSNRKFLGLVTAAIELEAIQNMFGEIALDHGSGITLFREDGTLLARVPRIDADVGRQFQNAVSLRIVSTADHGVTVSAGAINGEIRLIAARRVGKYPIVVSAGTTMTAVFADWWRTAIYAIGISTVTIAAIVAFAFVFFRMFRNYRALVKARAEREKAEHLQTQDLRFHVAVNNMSQGLLMFDASARIVVCNDRYRQMYRLPPDGAKAGITFLELIRQRAASGSFIGDPRAYCSELLDTMTDGHLKEHLVETPEGRSILVVNRPMQDGGWVATHEDITDKRRAEEERNQNREFVNQIIDNVPVSIIVKNASDRRIAYVNQATELLWGLARANAIGKTAFDLFPRERAELRAHPGSLDS